MAASPGGSLKLEDRHTMDLTPGFLLLLLLYFSETIDCMSVPYKLTF